jgi:hypothetical protein
MRALRLKRAKPLFALAAVALAAALVPVPAQPSAAAAGSAVGAVTVKKTVSRVHLIDGKNVVADKRTVTIKVNQTKQLHNRQEIDITWSGAHPTGNLVADPHAPEAADEEYPMVLLECRGVDSKNAPAAQRLSPETCWTQTPNERYLTSASLLFPPWRVDRYAAPADRKKVVGAPHPLPSNCFLTGSTEHWLHFVGANGSDYPGGPLGGCAGIAPEQTTVGSTAALPGNTTYAASDADGTGEAKFVVWTSLTNASLGCDASVRCSLVAVPIEGISCDVAAADLPSADRPKGADATAAEDACTSTGNKSVVSVAVAGRLWWSASNWRNRITIPLGFAPLPVTNCAGGATGGIQIYGSELMTAATGQWSSKFCSDPTLFPLTHVQTGETEARNLLDTRSIEGAFTSLAPDGGYATPTVSAPTAMTGFAIGYAIDDAHQHQYTQLRLTPRLLAKLLTESYPDINDIRNGWANTPNDDTSTDYRALANNPFNITQDPEFIALNPGVGQRGTAEHGAATLLMLSSESDLVHALTAYINADPEARAWLDGKPDPWGMVVNPNYRGIKLPVDSWPLLDTYEPRELYDDPERNPCLHQNPVPYLPLVASPTIQLSTISLDLQYAIQQSQVICQDVNGGALFKLVTPGLQRVGLRFMIGITSLADSQRYAIDTAALQTRVDGSAPSKFTDDAGRTFVAPDDASLRAASELLAPDQSRGIWRLPYDKLVGASGSTSAYPGAMLVNAAIPTKGLPRTEAREYATFLRFAAGAGQTPGGNAGQLPAGYLPLTSANGLGAQQHYTQIAAQYVDAQNGKAPSLTDPKALPAPHSNSSPAPATSSSDSKSTSGESATAPNNAPPAGAGSSSTPSDGGSTPAPSASPSAAPTTSVSPAAQTSRTSSVDPGWIGLIVLVLAIIALVAGLAFPVLGYAGRRRS